MTFSRRLSFLESGTDVNGMLEYLNTDFDYKSIVTSSARAQLFGADIRISGRANALVR